VPPFGFWSCVKTDMFGDVCPPDPASVRSMGFRAAPIGSGSATYFTLNNDCA
jgi:hypothetical protein